jgi:hypothetical protein
MTTQRLNITATTQQVAVIAAACDLLTRINIGHLEYIGEELIGHELVDVDYTKKHAALCELKHELFGLAPSANLGIFNDKVPDRARVAWDIAKVLKAALRQGTPAPQDTAGMQPRITVEPAPARVPANSGAGLAATFAAHAGRTMFVCAWADYEERCGRARGGVELFDVAPATPHDFVCEGWKLLGAVETLNSCSLLLLLRRAALADGITESFYWGTKYAEDFAYGCAMSSMGHGVGWFDNHARFPLSLPHIETPELDAADYPEPAEDQR